MKQISKLKVHEMTKSKRKMAQMLKNPDRPKTPYIIHTTVE